MSKFTDNLTAQRKKLRMTIPDVVAALEKRGISRAESTVAQWFNGTRGNRVDTDDIKALLDVLQTTFEEMYAGTDDQERVDTMRTRLRKWSDLSPEAQAVVDSMIDQLQGKK